MYDYNAQELKVMKCPLWKKQMAKVCHTCPMWVKIRGMNPNTGEDIDGYNCALAWGPLLAIENSKMQRETGAAVESLRNIVSAAQVPRAHPLNDERHYLRSSEKVKQIDDHRKD